MSRKSVWMLAVAAAGVALISSAGHADTMSDCISGKDSELRIAACSKIISAAELAAPIRADAYRARGEAYAERAAHQEAVADFTEAIKLRPQDGQAYYGRASSQLALQRTIAAVADLSEAIKYLGNSPGLFVARGYAQLVKGAPDEAIADFSVAIRLDPKNASALNNRGLAYRKKGDLDNAVKDYTAAIALNPVYALAFNNRGYVYEAKGDKKAAASDFRRALALDPSLIGAKKGLERMGEPGIASVESEKLIAQGKELAQRNCAWCHAIGKTGTSPNPRAPAWRDLQRHHPIQALRDPLTRGIGRPHDEMPKFQLSDDEVDTIVAYINSLAP